MLSIIIIMIIIIIIITVIVIVIGCALELILYYNITTYNYIISKHVKLIRNIALILYCMML